MANTQKPKNLASIAKKTAKKPAARKPAARKPAAKKPVAKKLTAAEERDIKAKETVKELLKDSPLTAPTELLEIDETPDASDLKGVEWLEQQVGTQAELIEDLRDQLSTAKEDFTRLQQSDKGGDTQLQTNVIRVFEELQDNYLKMGKGQNGQPNFRIIPVAFMNRLIMFFPFLKERKKF